MRFRLKGADKFMQKLGQYDEDALSQLENALQTEAELIMTRSKRDFVPVDQGVLRASGHVKPATRRGSKAYVELGYGGAASDYALVQHERMDFQHTVGQAKYLEQPVKDAASGFAKRVEQRMDLK